MKTIKIAHKTVGPDSPVFFIAEIGINHNGDLEIAKKLIDVAVEAGCDAVKFQKRDPGKSVPENQREIIRETPWGLMSYYEYKKKIEFWGKEYDEIDSYCNKKGIMWSASCWDLPSLEFIQQYDIPFYKIPSALITHKKYMDYVKNIKNKRKLPIILSTGMADLELLKKVVEFMGCDNLIMLHTVSTYPVQNNEVNLRAMSTLEKTFNCPVGYSGHEVGLQISLAAVAIGAVILERHVTLDRTMWGTDQAASIEPSGVRRLLRDICIIKAAMGTGEKVVLESEKPVIECLRKVNDLS
ncbi:N-acetylneuraminate synthase family protein [Candidatus Omnitrophota bacterium]